MILSSAAVVLSMLVISTQSLAADPMPARWTEEKAAAWYAGQPWLVGCNFIPSTAINELEMWQADTFDLPTIDRELGYAQGLGFTSVRVFLHHLPWQQDSHGYLNRLDQFLDVAHKHHIGAMFVLFDSCWDPFPKLGKQHDPIPRVHNSGWVQSPGVDILGDPARYDELKDYVAGVVGHFAKDPRVQLWDVMNEADNNNASSYGKWDFTTEQKTEHVLALIPKIIQWARAAKPDQPLTICVWRDDWSDPSRLSAFNRFALDNSDVITFHNYGPLDGMKKCVESLRRLRRPILCSEYMARPVGSTFQAILPYLKQEHIAAYNWGFVSGKTQTIYPWDSWQKKYTAEPPLWFHDIFRTDGSPYKTDEVELIRKLCLGK